MPTSARGLVVDFSELEFIDSSGIAMLFALVRQLGSRRQDLRVVAPAGQPVARVLEIVEFDPGGPARLGSRHGRGGALLDVAAACAAMKSSTARLNSCSLQIRPVGEPSITVS